MMIMTRMKIMKVVLQLKMKLFYFPGTSENSRAQTLSLSSLEEGTYQFRLTVSGGYPPVEGEAFGNVTVVPGAFFYLSGV